MALEYGSGGNVDRSVLADVQPSKYDREVYAGATDMFQTFFWAVFCGFVGAGLFDALVFHKLQQVMFWVTFIIIEIVLQSLLWVPYALWESGRDRYLAQSAAVTKPELEVVLPQYQPGVLRRIGGQIVNEKR